MIFPGLGCVRRRLPGVAADTTAPTLDAPLLNTTTGAIDLTNVSEPGTLFALINYSAAILSGAAIEAAVAGAELVTNGDFASDITGWTPHNSAALAWSGGQLSVDSNGSLVGNAYEAITTVIGKKYVLIVDVTPGTDTAIVAASTTFGSAGDIVTQSVAAASTATLQFTATATTTYVRLGRTTAAAGDAMLFDNVSVRELLATEAAATFFAVATGANAGTIDKSGVTPGTAYLHLTIKDPSGNYSTDIPTAFTQPAASGVTLGASTVGTAAAAPSVTVANPANAAGDAIYYFVAENAANALNLTSLPSGVTSVATLTSADRIVQVLKRTSTGSEAASETFSGGWIDRVAIAVTVPGGTAEGTPVKSSAWGTTLTAPSITVAAGSLVFEVFYARSALITRTGSIQSARSGTTGLAVSAAVGVAAGATAAQTATIGAGQQWGAAQVEIS